MNVISRLGTSTELRDLLLSQLKSRMWMVVITGFFFFLHKIRENDPGNRITVREILWVGMVSHQCWVMQPNPHILSTVCTAFNQGRQEGSFSSTEHRCKVPWGPILACHLGERVEKVTHWNVSSGRQLNVDNRVPSGRRCVHSDSQGTMGPGTHFFCEWHVLYIVSSSAPSSTHICSKPGFRCPKQGIAIGAIGFGSLGAADAWRGHIVLGSFTCVGTR